MAAFGWSASIPKQLSAQAVADIVYAQTGRLVRVDDPDLCVVDADDGIDGRVELCG